MTDSETHLSLSLPCQHQENMPLGIVLIKKKTTKKDNYNISVRIQKDSQYQMLSTFPKLWGS